MPYVTGYAPLGLRVSFFLTTVNIKVMSGLGNFYDEEAKRLGFVIDYKATAADISCLSVEGTATEVVIRIEGDFLAVKGNEKQSLAFRHLSNIASVVNQLEQLVSFIDAITGDYWDEEASWEESEDDASTKIVG